MRKVKSFKLRKEKWQCLRQCIANLVGVDYKKIYDIYKNCKPWRSTRLMNQVKKDRWVSIYVIEGKEICGKIMPLWCHIRVWKSRWWIWSSTLHACIYYENVLIYDPNNDTADDLSFWLIQNTLEQIWVLDWIEIDRKLIASLV